MVRLPLLLSLATASLAVGFGSTAVAANLRDGINPIVVSVDGVISPLNLVHVSVQLDGVASGNEILTVLDVTGDFISLPLTITPAAGSDHVDFYAIVSPFASGMAGLVVSHPGGQASWAAAVGSGSGSGGN